MKIRDGFQGSQMYILPQKTREELARDSFAGELYVTHSGYFPHARHHYRERLSGTDEYILLCCTDGCGRIECSGNVFPLVQGQYFVIPACEGHRYMADDDEPWSIYWLHYKGSMAAVCSKESGTVLQLPPLISPIGWKNVFEEILRSMERGYTIDNLRIASAALKHLIAILQFSGQITSVSMGSHSKAESLEKCLDYMRNHLDSSITLEDMVSVSGYSTTHCVNMFKELTGTTPMACLLRMRIDEACRLLEFTSLRINQICASVGIGDPYYFSRVFRKATGMSPSEWRTGGASR